MTSKTKPVADRVLSLLELDDRLDVAEDRWDRQVRKVIREMRTRKERLDVPVAIALESAVEGAVSWTRLYERQIRRLPKMDRVDEFHMARRYDFVRARLADALVRAGAKKDEVDGLIKRGRHEDPPKAKPAAREHLARCRADYEALRNHYVELSLHLVFSKVNRYRGLGVDAVDLVQEGSASLFQAIDGFDWRRDVRFNTYAQYWIHQAILKNLYDASRTVRLPVWVQKAQRKIQRAQEVGLHESGHATPVELVAEQLEMEPSRVEEIMKARRGAVSLDKPMFGDDAATIGQSVADDAVLPIEERVHDGDLGESLSAALETLPPRERLILERRFGLRGEEAETLADIAVDLGVTAERVRQLQNAALERLRKPENRTRLRAFA